MKIGDRVFVKSDACKSKVRDQYLLLNFVPNKNEAELQKIGKKKNIIQVQLQNILKVESDFKEDEPEDNLEESYIEEHEPEDHLEKNSADIEMNNQKAKGVRYRKRDELHQCHFCSKMDRKNSSHHYTECESLLQIRPGLRKHTKDVKDDDTEDSSDDDHPIDPQNEVNLLLFSDDELEDLSLHETILLATDYQLNLMDEND